MRRASRVDGNHRELFDAARQLGAFVIETHMVGKGCPDGFVWAKRTGWLAVEVKVAKGKLEPSQVDLHACCDVTIWRCYDDVLNSLAFRKRRL